MYDVFLIEKPLDEALTKEEIMDAMDSMNTTSYIPLEIEAIYHESSALGFLSSEAMDKLDGDTSSLKKFISSILDDMNLETDVGEYSFEELKIFMSRNPSTRRYSEFKVSTPAGNLVAYKGTDPDNPSVGVMLELKKSGSWIDLLYVETKSSELREEGETADDIFIYVYDDPTTDDYRHKYVIKGDLIKAIEKEEEK